MLEKNIQILIYFDCLKKKKDMFNCSIYINYSEMMLPKNGYSSLALHFFYTPVSSTPTIHLDYKALAGTPQKKFHLKTTSFHKQADATLVFLQLQYHHNLLLLSNCVQTEGNKGDTSCLLFLFFQLRNVRITAEKRRFLFSHFLA